MRRGSFTFKERLAEKRANGIVPFSKAALSFILLAALALVILRYLPSRVLGSANFIWNLDWAGLNTEQSLKDLKSIILPCIFIPIGCATFVTLFLVIIQTRFFFTFHIDNWRRASRQSKQRGFSWTVISLFFAIAIAFFIAKQLYRSIMPLLWADYPPYTASGALGAFSTLIFGMLMFLVVSSVIIIFAKRALILYDKSNRVH